ncbi:MAG TPA: class I SAM-dependent methyltransferase [Actinospica sp.]|nr:class I SAM-dependent methyltransferase [Actinospica sp.]
MSKPTTSNSQAQFESAEEYWGSYWPSAGEDTGGIPPVDRMHWTQYPGHGPGAELLGQPRTALEIGSATCVAGVALARATGAEVTCVDSSPFQVSRAENWWADEPGVTVLEADVVSFLAETDSRWDCVFSNWGAALFVDPEVLVPLVHARLNPGGLFAFSAVEPLAPCFGPQIKYGNGYRGLRLPIVRWMLSVQQWTEVLARHDFDELDVHILPAPTEGHVGTLLGRARTPQQPTVELP